MILTQNPARSHIQCRISIGKLNYILKFSFKKVFTFHCQLKVYKALYNNQINACILIGQSAVGYCASKPMEKSHVF